MKQTRRFLALLLAMCLCWSQVSPAFATGLDTEEQTEPVVVVEETEAAEVVETEAATEAAPAPETEAATEAPEVVETEAAVEEVIAEEAVKEDTDAAGTAENPEVLEYFGWVDLTLAEGDADGYYYTYTAASDGSIALYFYSVTEGVEADIIVAKGEEVKKLSVDGVDNYGLELQMDVSAGDVLTIQVVTITEGNPAAEISWGGNFNYPEGSEMNPFYPEWIWSDDQSEATATVTVPADTTYYFSVYTGMILTVNDGDPIVLDTSAYPITNDGTEAAEYTLKMVYAEGTYENPEDMGSLEYGYSNTTTIEEEDWSGRYFSYTAERDGYLTVYVTNVFDAAYNIMDGVIGDITVSKGWNSWSAYYEGVENDGKKLTIEVAEGDELKIQVSRFTADWSYPACMVSWAAELTDDLPATENNPLGIQNLETAVTVAAGTTGYYYGRFGGMILTINDASAAVTVNGQTYSADKNGVLTMEVPAAMYPMMPVYFQITNNGETDAVYALSFSYPVGTMNNPEDLGSLEYGFFGAAEIAAESRNPYYYTYTAEMDGYLTVYLAYILDADYNTLEGVTGDIIVNVEGTYRYPSLSEDGTENDGKKLTVEVSKGDVLNIQVTRAADDYSLPAANVYWYANISEYAPASENNPLGIQNTETSVTVAAGTTGYYYGRFGGMILTINDASAAVAVNGQTYSADENGVLTVEVPAVMYPMMPVYFQITNNGETDAVYALSFTYPVGHAENPEVVWDLSRVVASLAEGDDDGYYYSYYNRVATGTLVLTPTCATEGVEYDVVLTNMTTYDRAWLSDSADGTVSMAINPDDYVTIQVVVMPEDWNYPAAEIALNGKIVYPVGHQMNPAELSTEETNVAEVEAGSEGYYFTFTAPDRGELTFTMVTETGWTYVINNKTAGKYGDTQWSDSDPVVKTAKLSLNKGDEIEIIVNTYDPDNTWSNPAGTITFTTTYEVPVGAETNPIDVTADWKWNKAYTEATLTVTVPAGTTNYYNSYRVAGMLLSINGGETIKLTSDGIFYPAVFTITNDGEEAAKYSLKLTYPLGDMMNPETLSLGVNSVIIEEGNYEGYHYTWTAPMDGILEVGVSNENAWVVINNITTGKYGEADTYAYAEASKGDKLELIISTADPSVETEVSFDALFGMNLNVISGKSITLKYVNPVTGKSVNAKDINWEVVGFSGDAGAFNLGDADIDYSLDRDSIFKLDNGKLTTYKYAEALYVVVKASLKSDETGEATAVYYGVRMAPAVTKVYISGTVYSGDDWYSIWQDDTRALDVSAGSLAENGVPYVELSAWTMPDEACYDVKWTVSNSNLVEVTESDNNIRIMPKLNAKGAYTLGTVTVTATATDGSGKKASVKLNITKLVNELAIETKDGKNMGTMKLQGYWNETGDYVDEEIEVPVIYITAGQTLQLKAITNSDATNKNVIWPDWYDSEYISISNGKLKVAKDYPDGWMWAEGENTFYVEAYAKDGGVGAYTYGGCWTHILVKILPRATNVHARALIDGMYKYVSNTTRAYDITTAATGTELPLMATVYPFNASQKVVWSVSNKNVAKVVEYTDDDGDTQYKLVFTGKAGKVVVTATAQDGSKEKASFTLNVVCSVTSLNITNNNYIAGGKTLKLTCTTEPAVVSNKNVTWDMYMLDESGSEVAVPKTIATLSGASLKTKAVTEATEIYVRVTAKDGYGATATQKVTIYPATQGVNIYTDTKLTLLNGTTKDCGDGIREIYVESSNAGTAGKYSVTVSKPKDVEVIDNGEGYFTIKLLTENYGKVKVTATALDGSNKSAYYYINFFEGTKD